MGVTEFGTPTFYSQKFAVYYEKSFNINGTSYSKNMVDCYLKNKDIYLSFKQC